MQALSGDLRLHVCWHRYRATIVRLNIFHKCSDGMLQKLTQNLHTQFFAKEDILVGQGEYVDSMLIVWSGTVGVSDLRACIPFAAEGGSCFFEIALLAPTPLSCECTLTAKTFVTIATLLREDFQKVLQYFPQEISCIGLNLLLGCYEVTSEVAAEIGSIPVPSHALMEKLREKFALIQPDSEGKLPSHARAELLRPPSAEHRALHEVRIAAVEDCVAKILTGSAGLHEFGQAMFGNFSSIEPCSSVLEQLKPAPAVVAPLEALRSPRGKQSSAARPRTKSTRRSTATPTTSQMSARSTIEPGNSRLPSPQWATSTAPS